MKIHLGKEEGYMLCSDSTGKHEIGRVTFPRETLLDWYPLSVNYEYRLDTMKGMYFLAPREYSHPKKYGISKKKRNTATEQASFTPPKFFVQEVYEDNQEVLKRAEERGFPKLYEEGTTLAQIEALHKDLTYDVDVPIKTAIIDRAYENMKEEEWLKFFKSEEENKDVILYNYATKEELQQLCETGSLRILLNLLRKGVHANDI